MPALRKMTLAAGTRLGRYEIRSQLGKGGMGEVYLAEDTRLHRKVALKILPLEVVSNQDRMRRFHQEATTAAALNHANIAHVYEIDEVDGQHFIAMEFVEGVTLREKIHGEQTELPKLLQLLQQVAEGLTKAHAADIVHRDLKPDNIMITPDGFAKILDFGLAKLVEPRQPASSSEDVTTILQQHSVSGMILGTLGYMSPEQAQGQTNKTDHRSDIFSFGCILFEAATGRKAFEGKDRIDSLNKIIREPVAPISKFNPGAPADLQRIVRRCLAKDPDERYQTIKDVATELKELQRSELANAVTPLSSSAQSAVAATSQTVASTTPAREFLSTQVASKSPVPPDKRRTPLVTLIVLLLIGVPILAIIGVYIRSRGLATAPAAVESIAVLPLENQNRDPEIDYLTDGLTESIINNITKLPNLRVIARNSVFRFKGKQTDPVAVGQQLGVHAVLTGRALIRGENLIVSVELVDVRNNKQLWGEQYSRKLSDALAVQQEISREIGERLRLRLTSEDQQQIANRAPNNPEAYQYYLKGRYYWNRRTAENLEKAIDQFIQSADKDPAYGLAYAGLADCYVLLAGETPGYPESEAFQKAEEYAKRAVQVGDTLAEAHTSLALLSSSMWRWEVAEREYRRALELNPNYPTARHWYSIHLRDMGRLDEALAQAKRAHELDPLSSVISSNLALVYLVHGDVNSSIEESRKVIELDPNFRGGPVMLGLAYLKQQKYPEAIAALEKAVELSRASVELQRLGYGYAVSGQRVKALGIIKELKERFARQEARGYDIAAVYAGLGEKDQAFEWLEKDLQKHSGRLAGIRWHPPFESLRDDARFQNLLRAMGLAP